MEALYVGVVFVVLGLVLHMVSLKVKSHDLNNMTTYSVHLFATAVLAHLFMEYVGVNKWYCSNGNACMGLNKK
jgi:hypothetical protein